MVIKKLFSISAVLILLTSCSSGTYAKSIFGLSHCEKIEKQLNLEQEIGFENWKIYDAQRDALVEGKIKMNLSTFRFSSNLVKPVVDSDDRIVSLIDSNLECFSPAFVASVRNRKVGITENYAQLNYVNITLARTSKSEIIPGAYQHLEGFYDRYFTWDEQIKLDR